MSSKESPVARGGSSVSVLFVCLGNICRSPLAEGVFRELVSAAGWEERFHIDSAGTGAYHEGEAPDPRSVAIASQNGIHLTGIARQVTPQDLDRFDWVVAMDASNRRSLERFAGSARLVMMRDYDPHAPGADVPDPYYGGPGGFDEVFAIVERSCRQLLEELVPFGGAPPTT